MRDGKCDTLDYFITALFGQYIHFDQILKLYTLIDLTIYMNNFIQTQIIYSANTLNFKSII